MSVQRRARGGPQAGVPWTPSQVSVAAVIANQLGVESYWACPAKNAVYALFLYSPQAFTNSEFPYQLRVITYSASTQYYADSIMYLGGIAVDGTIAATEMQQGWRGKMVSKNKIVWNDGSVWQRVQKPIDRTINQYSPLSAYNQAADQSAYFNFTYNRAYPNLYKRIPF